MKRAVSIHLEMTIFTHNVDKKETASYPSKQTNSKNSWVRCCRHSLFV